MGCGFSDAIGGEDWHIEPANSFLCTKKEMQVEEQEIEVVTCERVTDWPLVYDAARATQGKTPIHKMPTDEWKRKMMLSPHSPIRALQFFIQVRLPYFVQGHITRHKIGVEFFCGSQRNDRQDRYDRRAARQDTPVIMGMLVNADALRFISRRRLCNKADPDTRKVWNLVVEAVRNIDPIVAEACHPDCWWNGGRCFEPMPCGKPAAS